MFPPFQPQYIQPDEYAKYGLPDASKQSDIDQIAMMASVLIDEACGAVDGDGNGSLCYTTYTERILMPTRNRNLITVAMKPMAAVDSDTLQSLQDAATNGNNYTFTGAQANTLLNSRTGMLSAIIGASGRYGYTRQEVAVGYPDLYQVINPLNLLTLFGGPSPWVSIDVTNTDYDEKTGEIWIPAGLQLQRYSEVYIVYNAGFNPLAMPNAIKFVCSSIMKNLLAKGDATTAMLRLQVQGGASVGLHADVIDPVLQRMLVPFQRIRAY